jgi:hypothetical protein
MTTIELMRVKAPDNTSGVSKAIISIATDTAHTEHVASGHLSESLKFSDLRNKHETFNQSSMTTTTTTTRITRCSLKSLATLWALGKHPFPVHREVSMILPFKPLRTQEWKKAKRWNWLK